MRYLVAGALLLLSQAPIADVDHVCLSNCAMKGYSNAYCQEACSYGSQGGSGNSSGGFIGGVMRAKEARAQQEQAAAQTKLIEEQIRTIQLENERHSAELSQNSRPAELPATGSVSPNSPGAAANNIYRDWQAAIETRKSLYPDFNDVVYSPGVEISGYMMQCMAHSPYAADIAYYLATHKNEAASVAKMEFLDTAAAIKEIEGRVSPSGR